MKIMRLWHEKGKAHEKKTIFMCGHPYRSRFFSIRILSGSVGAGASCAG